MDNKQATLELGTKPVGELLVQYALPAIVAMIASSLYNIVDRIFIGRCVDSLALAGLGITFPFMNLSAAFGAAIGVGTATHISVRLGQRDYRSAEETFGNSISLNIIIGILFATLSLIFLDPILLFFGASEQTLPYAREYMQIILYGNVFTHLYFGMNAVLRAASKPFHAMGATIFTVLFNAILDLIFIYILDLGIRSVAFATILSQITALIWQCWQFSNKKDIIHFERGIYKLRTSHVGNIISIGLSPFLMHVCSCLIVVLLNRSLAYYGSKLAINHGGDLAIGAYSIVHSISFLFLMIVFGLNQGMQPIAGYNYGAQRYDRLMQVLKYAIITATFITIVGFFISEAQTDICKIFTTDPTFLAIAVHGLKVANIAFPIIGYQIVVTNFFQSIGKAKVSIFLSLSRQLIFLLPMLLLLPPFFGLDGVWASLPASDILAAFVSFLIMRKYMKHFKAQQIVIKNE